MNKENRPEIIHIEETASTLSFIKELKKERTIENGFTVYVDFQRAGRGQRGNLWESERGKNLMFSTILYPKDLKANKQFILSQIVSLAIVDVLSKETSDISIKWPNDIYWKDQKIGGILIENDIMDDLICQTTLGVGINLNQTVFVSDAPNPVSLIQITKKTYDIKDVLQDIINRIYCYFNQLEESQSIDNIKENYKKRLFRREGYHLFTDEKETFSAEILDVENSGLLVLKAKSGNIQKYAFKEVKYVL